MLEDETLDFSNTWMNKIPDLDKMSSWGLYITACYNTIQTITTVGYGDLTAGNTLERGITVIIMMIGVISFSFATGSLSSILQNYDQANAKLQERIQVLNRIYKDY